MNGDVVTYTSYTDDQGRRQAMNVTGGGHPVTRSKPKRAAEGPAGRAAGVGSLAPVVLLIAAYFVADRIWFIPSWVAWLYLGASFVTFLAYAFDKSQAKQHGPRVSEATLLAFGLAGGWPGAIIAQLVFRHKTQKRSFRIPFWFTVAGNVIGVALILWVILSS